MTHTDGIDERAIDLIASRVAKALRDELADIAAGLGARGTAESALTVDAVVERLDVSRSTVYAHWREWGGYKLGSAAKAAIRFSPSALPTHDDTPPQRPETGLNQRPRGAGHVPAGMRSDRAFCRRVLRDRAAEHSVGLGRGVRLGTANAWRWMIASGVQIERPRLALSRRDAAAALGMSLSHFQRHIQPYVRCVYSGQLRLYPVTGDERWLEAQSCEGGRAV